MRTISKKRYLSAALEAEAKNDFIADKIKADKDQKADAKKDGKTTAADKDGNGKPDKPGVDKDGKFVKAGAKADVADDKKKGSKVAKEDMRTPAERAADEAAPERTPAERAPVGREPEAAPAEGEAVPAVDPEIEPPPVEEVPPVEGEPPVDGARRPADTRAPVGRSEPRAGEAPPEDGAEPPLEVEPDADVVPPADSEAPPADGEPEPDPELDPDAAPAPAEGEAPTDAPVDAPVDDAPAEADAIPPAADGEGEETPAETPPADGGAPADGLGENDPVDAAAAGSPTDDVPPSDDNPLADVPPADGEPAPAVDGLPPADLADGEAPVEGAEGGERRPAEGEPAIAPDGEVNDVEGELLEASDVEVEVEDNQRRIDSGLDAVRALESLYVSMEEARQLGGMDKIGGQIALNQVQYFGDRLGIPIASKFPALEDFNNYKSRLRANNVSLEGLREFIEKVWSGIRDTVLKSVAWFKSWYAKLFSAAKGLAARAKQIVARGNGGGGGVKTFQDETMAARLYIDHAVPHGAAGALILKDAVSGMLGNFEEHVHGCEALAAVFTRISPGTSLEATATTLDAALKDFNGKSMGLDLVNNPAADGFEAMPAGMQLWRSKELPGGKAVLFRSVTETSPDNIAKMGGALGEFKENRSEFIGKDVPYMVGDEAVKSATAVAELCLMIDKAEPYVGRAAKSKEILAASAAKIAKMDFDESSKAAMGRFQQAASNASKFMDQPYASFCAYALQTARQMLAQIERAPEGAEKPAEKPAA